MTTAEELIVKLIDEKKITGAEAVVLLRALAVKEKEYVYVDTWKYPYQTTGTPISGITYTTSSNTQNIN